MSEVGERSETPKLGSEEEGISAREKRDAPKCEFGCQKTRERSEARLFNL